MCCAITLYKWLMMHMPTKGSFVHTADSSLWSQRIMGLTSYDIIWKSVIGLKEIIIGYGEFPNVPLMGTRRCINYNPILARRQLGFAMLDRPNEQKVMDIVYFGKGEDKVLLEKVKIAWGHIRHKGKLSFSQN